MSCICKRHIFVFETGLQKLRSKCIFLFRSLLFLSAAEINIEPRRCLTETNFDWSSLILVLCYEDWCLLNREFKGLIMVLWIKTMRVLFKVCFLCDQIFDLTLRIVWVSCVRINGDIHEAGKFSSFDFCGFLSLIPTTSSHRKRKNSTKSTLPQLNQGGSSVFRIIEVGIAWNAHSWLIYRVAFLSITQQVRKFYNIRVLSLFTLYFSVLISRNLGDLELQ